MRHMRCVHEQKVKSHQQCGDIAGVCWGVFSRRHIWTLALGPLKGSCKQVLHGVVVEKNTAQDSDVPDIVTATEVIEKTWLPALRNLRCVDKGTDEIHHDALHDWCIEIHGPLEATCIRELSYGRETS